MTRSQVRTESGSADQTRSLSRPVRVRREAQVRTGANGAS
jgi:hypothetical protein